MFSAKLSQARECISFDDVLIRPEYTEISVADVDLSTNLTKKIKLRLPLLSAPMDTVTESAMAIALGKRGGAGVIHYNLPIDSQVKMIQEAKAQKVILGAAVGADDLARVEAVVSAGADFIVIDTAHGFKKQVIASIKQYKKTGAQIIAGNIVSREAAEALVTAGADALKVGMGPGAICTTRIVTGIGVPQLSAVADVADFAAKEGIGVIADGGIRYSGDVAKAIAAGASVAMMGNAFSGTDEAPGEIIERSGAKYKTYRGMGSKESLKANYAKRYEAFKDSLVPEGVNGLTPYKGSVDKIITQFEGGLKKAMVYVGARNIAEMQKKAVFIRISNSSLRESHPHSLYSFDDTDNYQKPK